MREKKRVCCKLQLFPEDAEECSTYNRVHPSHHSTCVYNSSTNRMHTHVCSGCIAVVALRDVFLPGDGHTVSSMSAFSQPSPLNGLAANVRTRAWARPNTSQI